MVHVVTGRFDSELEHTLTSLMERLEHSGIEGVNLDSPYRPHVTLSGCEELDVAQFSDDLDSAFREFRGVRLEIDGPKVFDNTSTIVHLSVTRSAELCGLQAQIHSLLEQNGTGMLRFTSADTWSPHTTLVWRARADQIDRIMDQLRGLVFPIIGTISSLGILDTQLKTEETILELRGEDV